MKFTKMHGAGNDYVYVDCFREKVENPEKTAILVSDRHFGIGSDGLILIKPSETADCQMDMYNLDGSRGAMCGNGIRCVGKYAYDHGIVSPEKRKIFVETLSGIKELDLEVENGKVKRVTVDMGEPEQTSKAGEKILVGETEYHFTGISMGNPHAVLFLDGDNRKKLMDGPQLAAPVRRVEKEEADEEYLGLLDRLNLEIIGPDFEKHPYFPNRVNTEFIVVKDETHLFMRVWERGSGETLACGTGTCASVAAAILNGYAKKDQDIDVSLLGGHLTIRWDSHNNHIYMTGEAKEVFQGEIDLSAF